MARVSSNDASTPKVHNSERGVVKGARNSIEIRARAICMRNERTANDGETNTRRVRDCWGEFVVTRHARTHAHAQTYAHASHVRRFTLTDVELICYGATLPRDAISILSILYDTCWFLGQNAFYNFGTEVKRVRARSNPRSKLYKPADKIEMTDGNRSVKKDGCAQTRAGQRARV